MAIPSETTSSEAASPERSSRQVHLDGRTLEGGGQLVRNALALSALTGRPVMIDHVRGNRGGKTGLKASHAAAVKLLAEISRSKVDGGGVGSQSVTFTPPRPSKETTTFPDAVQEAEDSPLASLSGISVQPEYNIRLPTPGSVFLIFQALYPYLLHVGARASAKCVKVTITGGTNGTNSPSYDYASQVMVPNFAKLGLPPLSIILHKRGWSSGIVGMGTVTFFIHPLGLPKTKREDVKGQGLSSRNGNVAAETGSFESRFPRINIMDYERGKITRIELTVLAPDERITGEKAWGESPTLRKYVERQTRRVVRRALKTLDPSIFEISPDSSSDQPTLQTTDETSDRSPRVPIDIHTSEPASHLSRLYLLIVAHTSTGFRIGHDALIGNVRSKSGKAKKHGKYKKGQKSHRKGGDQQKTDLGKVSDLIDGCVQGFIDELTGETDANTDQNPGPAGAKRSCLDKHMRDQVVVFEALGELHRDNSVDLESEGSEQKEDGRYWTLHTQTAQWVCREMLGDHGDRSNR